MESSLPMMSPLDDPESLADPGEVNAALENLQRFAESELQDISCSGDLAQLFPFQLHHDASITLEKWHDIVADIRG